MNNDEPCCSFCLRPKSKAVVLLASFRQDAFICDECVSTCTKVIRDHKLVLAQQEWEASDPKRKYWCGICGEPVDGPAGKCSNIGNEDHRDWR